ncbi:MAG: DUF5660 family protein [Patescibacteria group bacterium]
MADNKKKSQKEIRRQNVLESLKDLGAGTSSQMGDLLKSTSEDFFKELLGLPKPQKKVSGELQEGQSLQMNEAMSGKAEENKLLRQQISMERQMAGDEKALANEKMQKLRVQLQAMTSEIAKLASATQGLAQETQVAMMTAPVEPGVYHVIFFEKVLEFLQAFRKKIENASVWLAGTNKRAEKKNYWSMYKKKGSSFLLSPDHYLQRSAG